MKITKKLIIAWSICFPLIVILIVGLIVGNAVLYSFEDQVNSFLCPPIADGAKLEEARAGGETLSKQIVEESSVLVKNENGTLPLDLETNKKVNVFGWAAINWVFGGSGSGQVFDESNDSLSDTVGLLEALENYGVQYNTGLIDMYKKYNSRIGDKKSIYVFQNTFYRLCEPSISEYTGNVLAEAKSFSPTALVVLGRRAGETEDPTRVQYKEKKGTDESRTYLEISTEEEELLKYVGANYEKVIVIINSTNVMELGFLDTIPGLDACLVVGATGTKGATGIPSVLYGKSLKIDENGAVEDEIEISPSGRFVDTYAYDFESNINYRYSGDAGVGHYTNANGLYPDGISRNAGEQYTTATYVDYVEGIYVGYKWFETADKEGIWEGRTRTVLGADGQQKTLTDYESVVQYPFGYGLSYTTFSWEVTEIKVDDKAYAEGITFNDNSVITVSLRVTNTGSRYGRDVIEVYVTPPYDYESETAIEKSYVSLVGFAKTINLEAGSSQDLSVTVKASDFASYDCYDANKNGFKGYELEAGDYQIKLMSDSHNVRTVKYGGEDMEGTFTLGVAEDIRIETDQYTQAEVFNKFTGEDAKETQPIDGSAESAPVEYITRKGFPNPYTFAKTADRAMADGTRQYNLYSATDATNWNGATTDLWGNPIDTSEVTWGSGGKETLYKSDGTLTDLGIELAKDYNSPKWDSVLDQVSISEARNLAENAAFCNQAVSSIGKPRLSDYDGPAQVKSFNAPGGKGTGFPCSGTMAQSWSTSLIYSFGINYGKEMDALSVSGAYAFGCNLHRSPFAGRNYEYLSEDGFMTAALLTQEVKGLKNMGKYTYLKHLVLGECEHDREAMYTWLTEQALREIYLKPFQMAIEEGGCVGIMTSYNRIGNVWTGGCESLITGILRNEWGYNGTMITDYADHPAYMSGDQAVRAGSCISMNAKFNYGTCSESDIRNNPRLAHRFRDIVHQVAYAHINALYTNSTYNEADDVEKFESTSARPSWIWWPSVVTVLDVAVGAGALIAIWYLLRPLFAKKLGLAAPEAETEQPIGDSEKPLDTSEAPVSSETGNNTSKQGGADDE